MYVKIYICSDNILFIFSDKHAGQNETSFMTFIQILLKIIENILFKSLQEEILPAIKLALEHLPKLLKSSEGEYIKQK